MDKWFDIMNAGFYSMKKMKNERRPFDSMDDERLRWLEETFPNYLDEWRDRAFSRGLPDGSNRTLMLLSTQAEEGLRIASKSMIAIVKKCLSMGADYVLPRRVNQDPLEAFFGYQRQKVSRGDTPSQMVFSATARSAEAFRLHDDAHPNIDNARTKAKE